MTNEVYKMQSLEEYGLTADDFDFLLFASGSDGRAYTVVESLGFGAATPGTAVLVHFKERVSWKRKTNPIWRYEKLGINNLHEIKSEIRDPSTCIDGLKSAGLTTQHRVGIDISCFTKPYFFFLAKYLKDYVGLTRVTAFYTEPKSYFFPRGIFSAFHSSSGPISIGQIPGFPGKENRGSKRVLIILLGFDGDLSFQISDDISQKQTLIVNGFPSYSPKFKDVSLVTNERLVCNHNIEVHYARANNPFEVYNLLDSIRRDQPNAFMSVAPLGTKPMALGACLFALHNPSVKIVYPLPQKYEDKYSEQHWNSWSYDLPLVK